MVTQFRRDLWSASDPYDCFPRHMTVKLYRTNSPYVFLWKPALFLMLNRRLHLSDGKQWGYEAGWQQSQKTVK